MTVKLINNNKKLNYLIVIKQCKLITMPELSFSNNSSENKQKITKKSLSQSPISNPQLQILPFLEESEDFEAMQKDYQQYYLKKEVKQRSIFPINEYRQNCLNVVGTRKGRLLCKIHSVAIEPSLTSQQLQREANRSAIQSPQDQVVKKFWNKRYFLFQKFDQDIKLDKESWFSVTPQAVAEYIATKMTGFSCVLDGFCGSGGDTIQLGLVNSHVIANDIDPQKIEILRHNAAVYGVTSITTLNKSFLDLCFEKNELSAIYLSPPWGGPEYFQQRSIAPSEMEPSLNDIINKAFTISNNLAMLLPCNIDIELLAQAISKPLNQQKQISTCTMVVEKIFFLGRLKFLLVLFGSKVSGSNLGKELDWIYGMFKGQKGQFKGQRAIKLFKERYGMVRLLNSIFECQGYAWKHKNSLYQKFLSYVMHKQLLTKTQLQQINQTDDFSSRSRHQTKLYKQKVKSISQIPNAQLQAVKEQEESLNGLRKNLLDDTQDRLKIQERLNHNKKQQKIGEQKGKINVIEQVNRKNDDEQ